MTATKEVVKLGQSCFVTYDYNGRFLYGCMLRTTCGYFCYEPELVVDGVARNLLPKNTFVCGGMEEVPLKQL